MRHSRGFQASTEPLHTQRTLEQPFPSKKTLAYHVTQPQPKPRRDESCDAEPDFGAPGAHTLLRRAGLAVGVSTRLSAKLRLLSASPIYPYSRKGLTLRTDADIPADHNVVAVWRALVLPRALTRGVGVCFKLAQGDASLDLANGSPALGEDRHFPPPQDSLNREDRRVAFSI